MRPTLYRYVTVSVFASGIASFAHAQVALQAPGVAVEAAPRAYWQTQPNPEWHRREEFREEQHRRAEWQREHCVRDWNGREFCRR